MNRKTEYELDFTRNETGDHYYISYRDVNKIQRKEEVPYQIFQEFRRSLLAEANQQRSDRRHIERLDITEREISERDRRYHRSVEEFVEDKIFREELEKLLTAVTPKQRRRFLLYHEYGLTYQEIADLEGTSKKTVYISVQGAVKKVKKMLK